MPITTTASTGKKKIQQWLSTTSSCSFTAFCGIAAFITYCSMYAFRKPFTAAAYDGILLWGIDYKILLIIAQLIGYTLSKFIGIKVVAELAPGQRIAALLLLIGIAWLSLLLFGITPYPYNVVFMFINGLPLGMIWGVVFSFLEGRRITELLGAFMASSFIVSSGFVKAAGKSLIHNFAISEYWMPFFTGLLFLPLLLTGIWMLGKIPPPTAADEALRTQRIPMNSQQRRQFFMRFAPGICIVVFIYITLTVFRDIRDNFAVEIWAGLGYTNITGILAWSEIPVAVAVLVMISAMMLIKNNRMAFYINLVILFAGGLLLLVTTYLQMQQSLNPVVWMIVAGFAMYLPYIIFHTMLFERWIAMFRHKSNIGFLMYICDAAGYTGSTIVLLYKNFGHGQQSWLQFFHTIAIITGAVLLLLSVLAIAYFLRKERRLVQSPPGQL